VASIWEKADTSIQQMDGIIQRLTPDDHRQGLVNEEQEQVLSTVETAALLHGQIKVSLMLIELKLRNNLSCLQSDKLYLGIKPDDETLLERLDTIQDDAMTAIEQVQAVLEEQLGRLEEAYQDDEEEDDENDDDDDLQQQAGHMVDDSDRRRSSHLSMRRLTNRQSLSLEDRLSECFDDENDFSRQEIAEDGTVQQFVSTRAMEKFQDQVAQILGSLQEKNAEIVRLKVTVDELTVRERSLMHELRRVMAEQAKIEAAERQRRMEAMKAMDTDDDDDPTTEHDDNDNGSGFASSVEFSEEDYDEVTYYEEVVEE
jgi:hypothetical protein